MSKRLRPRCSRRSPRSTASPPWWTTNVSGDAGADGHINFVFDGFDPRMGVVATRIRRREFTGGAWPAWSSGRTMRSVRARAAHGVTSTCASLGLRHRAQRRRLRQLQLQLGLLPGQPQALHRRDRQRQASTPMASRPADAKRRGVTMPGKSRTRSPWSPAERAGSAWATARLFAQEGARLAGSGRDPAKVGKRDGGALEIPPSARLVMCDG